MSGPTNEAGLVAAITRAIKKHFPSAWVFKVHGSPVQMAGVPDLLVCHEGRLLAFEVKFQRPGESREHALSRVSPIQRAQITALQASGATALPVLSPEEVLEVMYQAAA